MKYNLDQYDMAAIIGFWRMGNPTAVIVAIIDTSHFLVEKTIYDYKLKNNIK